MVTPKYLTISDDLQILPGDDCLFLSKSKRSLEAVESEVEAWVDYNPTHPRRIEAERWLDAAFDEIQRRLSIEDRKKVEDAAIHDMEKLIRQNVRITGRSKGWSRDKIQQEARRRAGWATKLLNDDPDELIAELRQSKPSYVALAIVSTI